MKNFSYKLIENTGRTFWGMVLLWHVAAIALTYALVVSGFDWAYFVSMRGFTAFLFPAAIIGFFVPVFLPIMFFAGGVIYKFEFDKIVAYALAQAAAIGLFVSSFYKAFTGRAHPELFSQGGLVDISREFHFGILNGGVFWGWPSSHTTVAFAIAAALWTLYPKNKLIRILAALYALYIGIGVSATIHWFSDFAAGAIIGIVIGITVGRSFMKEKRQI